MTRLQSRCGGRMISVSRLWWPDPLHQQENMMERDVVDPRDRRRGGVESPVAGEAPALTTPASAGLGGGTSQFQVFRDKKIDLANDPRPLVDVLYGILRLNCAAHELLDNAERVELLFDPVTATVGVRAAGPDVEHGLKVSTRVVSLCGFISAFRLKPLNGIIYQRGILAEMADGVLRFEWPQPYSELAAKIAAGIDAATRGEGKTVDQVLAELGISRADLDAIEDDDTGVAP